MDLWVVAAATGAGYLAKYWQNLSGEKDGLSESYPASIYSIHKNLESQNLLQAIGDRTYPRGRSARKKLQGNVSSGKEDGSDGKFQEIGRHGGHSAAGVASTSGSDGNIMANAEYYGDYNVLPQSNLPLGFSESQVFQENVYGLDVLPRFETKETSSLKRLGRNKSLKSRRSRLHIVKPLNSLESCLTSQLNEEHEKVEENVYSVPQLSRPMVRPLLVTNGSQIIHKVSRDSFDVRFDSGKDQCHKPSGLVELPRKPKQRVSSGSFHSQGSFFSLQMFWMNLIWHVTCSTLFSFILENSFGLLIS